ncbi:hypothetical protein [Thiothrix lacustris]|nr:hypothetical protein [Thiothrix lacustris]WMP15913.1 hypothetical protein RCS87_10950 [Thiothrix lacustris]
MGKPHQPKHWRFRIPQTHRQGGAGGGRNRLAISAETPVAIWH